MTAACVCVRVVEEIPVDQAGPRNQVFEDRQSTLRTPSGKCVDQIVFAGRSERDGMMRPRTRPADNAHAAVDGRTNRLAALDDRLMTGVCPSEHARRLPVCPWHDGWRRASMIRLVAVHTVRSGAVPESHRRRERTPPAGPITA